MLRVSTHLKRQVGLKSTSKPTDSQYRRPQRKARTLGNQLRLRAIGSSWTISSNYRLSWAPLRSLIQTGIKQRKPSAIKLGSILLISCKERTRTPAASLQVKSVSSLGLVTRLVCPTQVADRLVLHLHSHIEESNWSRGEVEPSQGGNLSQGLGSRFASDWFLSSHSYFMCNSVFSFYNEEELHNVDPSYAAIADCHACRMT